MTTNIWEAVGVLIGSTGGRQQHHTEEVKGTAAAAERSGSGGQEVLLLRVLNMKEADEEIFRERKRRGAEKVKLFSPKKKDF